MTQAYVYDQVRTPHGKGRRTASMLPAAMLLGTGGTQRLSRLPEGHPVTPAQALA